MYHFKITAFLQVANQSGNNRQFKLAQAQQFLFLLFRVLCLSKHAQYQSLWSTPSCAISVGSFALYRSLSFQILNLFVAFLLCICMKLKSTTQQRYATILDIHYYIDKLFSYAVHVLRSTCLNRHANDKAKQLSVFIIFFYYF